MDLSRKKCKPCESGTTPFGKQEVDTYMKVIPGWGASEDLRSIERTYSFKDFKGALAFVNKIGAIAEDEGHHPDICFGWGTVTVSLTTHAIRGLSENDFIVAFKIDTLNHV